MASKKLTGNAPTGVRRSPSRQAGPTSMTVRSGTAPDAPPSTTTRHGKRRDTHPSPKSLTNQTTNSRSNLPKSMTRPVTKPCYHVWGPFWSDAMKAYRVEYYERRAGELGGMWSSSFLCERQQDAERLGTAARKVTCREDWLELREMAVALVREEGAGLIYRVMAGERETFIPDKPTVLPFPKAVTLLFNAPQAG